MLSGQLVHKRTLAHRGEAYEADTGNTGACDIEANTCAATSATTWLQQLPLEFSEFCLQLS